MIVVDDDTCMVELAKYFLTFATAESCGKCVPCRIGGQRLLEVLTRITEGSGTRKDLATIRETLRAHDEFVTVRSGPAHSRAGDVRAAVLRGRSSSPTLTTRSAWPASARRWCAPSASTPAPPGVDTPAYLALIAQGRYAEGLAIHRERNPFPIICGRACPAFCETKCRRAEMDEPIAIRLTQAIHGRPRERNAVDARTARLAGTAPPSPPEKGRGGRRRPGRV